MLRKCLIINALIFLMLPFVGLSQGNKSFKIIPLGIKGGIDESNLSAYMVAPAGSDNYICLDAGTLHYGIEKAIANKVFYIPAEQVLKKYIKGYFISHAHLDHVAGLIINSPDDSTKSIYGLSSCLETIKTHYFTWESWANFADEGEAPQIKKYHYQVLTPDSVLAIKNTEMSVRAFPLSHSNLQSTAFLVKSGGAYILYLGDVGPDEIEKSHSLHLLWEAISPLVKSKQLKAIMIETSFPNEQPDKTLFGHLTPNWLMREMDDLAMLTGSDTLNGFNLVITHVKPPQDNINKLKAQLRKQNELKLNLIFPEQGREIDL
ncbi:3',5'-cyclic-nucleotide phosphodiesterase [Mucilaginibacter sp. BJC16-A38]|uniref:MBL fold metallo-hydrolase n=1 Tax=Mucilaginibacter phenanthrenivorans TaxID=1234842 RepID=UPI0021575F16|nr:3',5'-cyclic-nucleotide phosphodiesterase [Mucilaginibacter phenanthrenivorans]MCR8556161.1 3',5'-cyclic-nucleotide phosphodiesterase [Mucilaginibacter phenanthrenivorans]